MWTADIRDASSHSHATHPPIISVLASYSQLSLCSLSSHVELIQPSNMYRYTRKSIYPAAQWTTRLPHPHVLQPLSWMVRELKSGQPHHNLYRIILTGLTLNGSSCSSNVPDVHRTALQAAWWASCRLAGRRTSPECCSWHESDASWPT